MVYGNYYYSYLCNFLLPPQKNQNVPHILFQLTYGPKKYVVVRCDEML